MRQREDPDSITAILGHTEGGRRVSLLQCFRSHGRLNIPGYFVSHYRARLGTVGHRWFLSAGHLKVRRLEAAFHNLEEFAGFTGLRLRRPLRRKFSVEYQQPRRLRLRLDDYRLELGFRGWTSGDGSERLSVEQQAWVSVESRTRKHVDDILDGPLRTISSMLELACGGPIPVLAVRAVDDVKPGDKPLRPETEVLFAQTNPLPPPNRLYAPQLAFTLATLGANAAAAIARWHQGRKRLGPTVDLFFSVARMHRAPLEHVFLFLAQALESYHRRTWTTPASEHAGHRRRVRRILAAVQGLDRSWLSDWLKYSGEPSLNRRLKDVYEGLPRQAQVLLGEKHDFCRKISVTRNYLTHFDKRLQREALRGSSLRLASVKLRLILRIVLLRELGVTEVNKLSEQRLLEEYATRS